MTQSLQESLKILQLSTIELNEYIEQELERNPLLTSDEDQLDPLNNLQEAQDEEFSSDESDIIPIHEDNQDDPYLNHDFLGNHFTSQPTPTSGNLNQYNLEDLVTRPCSLKEHVLEQIYLGIQNPTLKTIACYLADMLNDDGYLEGDINEIPLILECNNEQVNLALQLVQKFEPTGVFARNLSECLAIQLREQNKLNDRMQALLDNLDLVAKAELESLQRICNVSVGELRNMLSLIKNLSPKPGSIFAEANHIDTIPDVFIHRTNEGKLIVELNNQALPKLLFDRHYYAEVKGKAKTQQDQQYLSQQLQSANSLIRALDQRAKTILKVSTEIVYRQQQFFEKGITQLKPMTLKDIAESLSIHESTVSRVTSNKYMVTPLGNFAFKYFFSSSISNDYGENCSSTVVKYMIKELISGETIESILSDEKITSLLKAKNINIARRTVAKYREALNIAPAAKRKIEKIVI